MTCLLELKEKPDYIFVFPNWLLSVSMLISIHLVNFFVIKVAFSHLTCKHGS